MARPDERPSVAHEVERDVVTQLPDVEVFDVQLSGGVLRVTIDHPQGVDHEVCSRVSNVLRDYTERYQLEVSSPGIPRPLVRPKHFQRSVGQPDRRRDPRGDRRQEAVHRRRCAMRTTSRSCSSSPIARSRLPIPLALVRKSHLVEES